MDKTGATQDNEVETQDTTSEKTEAPPEKTEGTLEEKKTTPKEKQKLYTEDDLRERGRDNATLTQRRKELDERETRVQEDEEKAKWNPVIEKYGQEKADAIKAAGLKPDQVGSIAELLGTKAPPTVQKADSGETSGGEDMPKSAQDKMRAGWTELHK